MYAIVRMFIIFFVVVWYNYNRSHHSVCVYAVSRSNVGRGNTRSIKAGEYYTNALWNVST